MATCLKCSGTLRYDQEFPGMVCQMCGAVYYSDPYREYFPEGRRIKGGWHRPKAA